MLASCGEGVNIEHGGVFKPSEISLGDRSGIGVDCFLQGPLKIGRDVMMGPEVLIFTTNHNIADTTRPMIEQGFSQPLEVTIGDDVWIGQRAIILPGVHIGRGAVIGAAAVVSKDVPEFAVVVGSPARVVRYRNSTSDHSSTLRTAV